MYKFFKNKKGKDKLYKYYSTYINDNGDPVFQYKKVRENYYIDGEKIYIEKKI